MSDEPKDPIKKYSSDVFTVPASLAGLPCMSIPVRLNSNQLPLGLQVMTNLYDEETLLRVGYVLEGAAKFTRLTV